jgi:hypothetical protein
MTPAPSTKTAKRGDTITFDYGIEEVNLSNATVHIQVRRPEAGVVFDSATQGTLTKTWANNETRIVWKIPYALVTMVGCFVFDVEITDNGERNTWIVGTLEITADITR